MFHVKRMCLLLFILVTTESYSQGVLTLQDKPFVYIHNYDTAIVNRLSSSKSYASLSAKEKEVFYWTNYFRQNPLRFYQTVVVEFLIQYPEARSPYSRSLEKDVKNAPENLPFLMPDDGLFQSAGLHASELVRRGNVISHNSSNGKSFVQRLQESGKYNCGAENVFVGSFSALESLIMLLIDHGVPDTGHRLNLLDRRFARMGVSFQPAGKGKGLMVQDFACP
jgi:Cysteine-rich secretory protein family